jgi:hypothetical protein
VLIENLEMFPQEEDVSFIAVECKTLPLTVYLELHIKTLDFDVQRFTFPKD